MKKTYLTLAIAGVAVLALGLASLAFAQTRPPGTFPNGGFGSGMMGNDTGSGYGMMDQDGPGYGHGMMDEDDHGDGMMGEAGHWGDMMGNHDEMEALHDYMEPAMAEALGLTPEEFDARHEAGETFREIAESQGLTADEAWGLMQTAREGALQQAVADGVISQDFADGMLTHMDAMNGEGFSSGGHCGENGSPGPQGRDF